MIYDLGGGGGVKIEEKSVEGMGLGRKGSERGGEGGGYGEERKSSEKGEEGGGYGMGVKLIRRK